MTAAAVAEVGSDRSDNDETSEWLSANSRRRSWMLVFAFVICIQVLLVGYLGILNFSKMLEFIDTRASEQEKLERLTISVAAIDSKVAAIQARTSEFLNRVNNLSVPPNAAAPRPLENTLPVGPVLPDAPFLSSNSGNLELAAVQLNDIQNDVTYQARPSFRWQLAAKPGAQSLAYSLDVAPLSHRLIFSPTKDYFSDLSYLSRNCLYEQNCLSLDVGYSWGIGYSDDPIWENVDSPVGGRSSFVISFELDFLSPRNLPASSEVAGD